MATYFVASGGSNTSPYDTWAKAATSLQTALTAASTDGDIVVIQYNGVPTTDASLSADTTYTVAADIKLISASADDAGTAYTPTVMGSGNFIGHGSSNRSITFLCAGAALYCFGVHLKISYTLIDHITLTTGDGSSTTWDDCIFELGGGSTQTFRLSVGSDINSHCHLKNCEFVSGHADQEVYVAGRCIVEGLTLSGAAISTVFSDASTLSDGNATDLFVHASDLSNAASGAALVKDVTKYPLTARFHGCKLPTAYVALVAGATNNSGGEVFIHDCAVGDTHGIFGYHNPLGALLTDTSITYTGGAAGQSWKIVTTSYCSLASPFITPWISLYHTGTSAITPRLEILRDGSSTAYTDQQVWGEFSAKTTSGTTLATTYSDGTPAAASGTAQATGAGLGSWSGESGTAWSGKVDSGAAITPAEAGHIRGRVVVSAASATVYVDPVIRTA